MHFITAITAAVLTGRVLAVPSLNPFSNTFSVGFGGQTSSFIREVTTTLILPPINPNQNGTLKLYPELYTGGTASLTGTAISVLDDSSPCANNPQEWCVGARLVLPTSEASGGYVPARIGSRLTFRVCYDDETGKYVQQVSLDGAVVSTLSVTSGDNPVVGTGTSFRTQVECRLGSCGAVASHSYVDTTIVLAEPDPSFDTTKKTVGTTGDLQTSDGGLTWYIDEIVVMSFTY